MPPKSLSVLDKKKLKQYEHLIISFVRNHLEVDASFTIVALSYVSRSRVDVFYHVTTAQQVTTEALLSRYNTKIHRFLASVAQGKNLPKFTFHCLPFLDAIYLD